MAKFSYIKARFAAYRILDTLSLILPAAAHTDDVLIVRQDAIGDFVMWVDAAHALVDHYRSQGRKVTLLANRAWANWAEQMQLFDRVIPLDTVRFQYDMRYRFRTSRLIRRCGFSMAVQPAYSRDYSADILIRLSNARERIGSTGDGSNVRPWERKMSERSYTRLIPADPKPQMELLRNAQFVRALLQNDYRACVSNLLELNAVEHDATFSTVMPKTESYYALFPGASWDGKQWPTANFRELAERVFRRTGWRGVVCGGPGDRELVETLCADNRESLLNWAGRTTLPQLAGVLAGAKFLVSNDTSAVHVAASVGTQAVCMLGGGHFGRFLPYEVERSNDQPLPIVVDYRMPCYGCNWVCIYDLSETKTAPCVGDISVEAVWEAVQGLDGVFPPPP